MKIGLALYVGLAAVLAAPALADPTAGKPEKPRYSQTGALCTAEDIASRPLISIEKGARTYRVRADCRTEGEWRIHAMEQADQARDMDRWRSTHLNTPGVVGVPPNLNPVTGQQKPSK